MRGWFGFFRGAGIWEFWLPPVACSPNSIMGSNSHWQNPVERNKLCRIMPASCWGKICFQRFRSGKIRLATFLAPLAPGVMVFPVPGQFSCTLGSLGLHPSSLHMTRRADSPFQLEEYFRCRAGSDFSGKLEYGGFGFHGWPVRRIPSWDRILVGRIR